ncbi:Cell wall integrity/stress response component-like protein [Quillaja saponaria]|uniref:Cell wall integrity/stress response component-like protein n=1 Tax=Quillaja saponaria TaxID=32244 RepID=A0AAD7LG98_QUISA|nr:Cell wall integrity/stress response component-like protein [Quillaja saponaria]
MAPLLYFGFRKVVVFSLLLFLFATVTTISASSESQIQNKHFLGRRRILEADIVEEQPQPVKKKTTSLLLSSTKNQTKLVIKPNLSLKNQTKPIKSNTLPSKNQTKLAKTSSDSTKLITPVPELKKLNSTSKFKKLNSTSKSLNSTKSTSISNKKSLDLLKQNTNKNKTTKPTATKETKLHLEQKLIDIESDKSSKNQKTEKKPNPQKLKKETQPSWIDQEDDGDLVSEFRDLPMKFQQTLIPDLEVLSTTSKAYISKANKEITKGFKPFVGKKYASTIATLVSFAFILIPLLLVSLIFNRIKAYFSIQKLLIFIQVYLSIYFSILCLSSLVTGLEPLKFLYATSRSTYVCLQVLQTLGYIFYLLLLLMYLILVFSTESGMGTKLLGLGQTLMGFAVGLHYYVTVFHRVVLHQPPKTNWKIHGIYATCFLVICLCARAERRKKSYLEEGGEEGKKS